MVNSCSVIILTYINDLYNVCRDSVPILFADDTIIFYKGNKMDDLVEIINGELENIALWLNIDKLSLNIKKTYFIIVQTHDVHSGHIKLIINLLKKLKKQRFYVLLLIQNYRGKKTYFSSGGKIIQEYWHDHQGKSIFEQKCSFNSLLILCVSLFNILQPCLGLHVLHQS